MKAIRAVWHLLWHGVTEEKFRNEQLWAALDHAEQQVALWTVRAEQRESALRRAGE